MKRKVKALIMAVLMLVMTLAPSFVDAVTVKAAEELTLKLHYHRADGNYDGWDVWLWEEGGEGAGYAFEEEDGEMVATKVITPGVTSVGFIVRTADWTKDVDADQFIDLTEMVSGTVHIYVESGVEGYSKEYGEDAVVVDKTFSIIYCGMIAEEQKAGTKLGKRIKRLGIHVLLIDNQAVGYAAHFMRGMGWKDIDSHCQERGF